VNRHLAIPVRKRTWAIAALFLIAFGWLGFAAVGFGALFHGIEVDLPVANRFALAYGPIAFPLFGFVAAAAFIFSDVLFRNRWVQPALIALFALVIICALRALLISGVFMVPTVLLDRRSEFEGFGVRRLAAAF
jgi:hypothetical protein